jgi:predicted small secreted protein
LRRDGVGITSDGTATQNEAFSMRKRLALIAGLALSAISLSGCVPVAIGAGGAIAADTIAEDRGGDLF